MSHVHVSFEMPEYVANVDAIGTLRILESVKTPGLENKTRIYHASTSELYGKVQETPQNEKTPFHPRSPYAAAKNMHTGSQEIIEKHMAFSHLMVFYLTMKVLEEERLLLLVR